MSSCPCARDLDESSALAVTAVRAFEIADRRFALWSDGDRAWASRAAAEVVGETGTAHAFLAQRAQLALGRLGERFKVLPRVLRSLGWPPCLHLVIGVAAFVAGVAMDRVGDSQRINILTPPVLALLAWNLAVYTLLAVGRIVHFGDLGASGPLRHALTRIASRLKKPHAGGELGEPLARFADDWARAAAPLYGVRAARILHSAAAILAGGLLTGLYLRGLAFEYRATWESTFLDADSVRRVLGIALAPGAMLTGLSIPAVDQIAAIRAPAGENAARWLHLMAASVALVVIIPRLLLAFLAWLRERHHCRHFAIALDDPYFQRLLRSFRGQGTRVQVQPYSYSLSAALKVRIEELFARTSNASVELTISPSTSYGDEHTLLTTAAPRYSGYAVALFNATATPEREAHGIFLEALAAQLGPEGILIALVDESTLRSRGSEQARIEERRRAWRELGAQQRVPCAFIDLAAVTASELAEAAATVEGIFDEARQ